MADVVVIDGTNLVAVTVGEVGPPGGPGVAGPSGPAFFVETQDGDDGMPVPGPAGPTGLTGAAGAVLMIDADAADDGMPVPGPQGPVGLTGATGGLIFVDVQDGDDGMPVPGPQGLIGLTGAAGAIMFVDVQDGDDGMAMPPNTNSPTFTGATTVAVLNASGLVSANAGLTVAGGVFTSRGITDSATALALAVYPSGRVGIGVSGDDGITQLQVGGSSFFRGTTQSTIDATVNNKFFSLLDIAASGVEWGLYNRNAGVAGQFALRQVTGGLNVLTASNAGLVSLNFGLTVAGGNFTSRGISDQATATALIISAAGNVGVGGSPSSAKLHILGGGANRVAFTGNTGTLYIGFDGANDALQVASNQYIAFQAGGTYAEAGRVFATGRWGINTSTDDGVNQLQVAGSGKFTGALTLGGAAPTAAAGQVAFGGTTATTIGANGAAAALTANPLGYLLINIAGAVARIPYYN